MFLTTIAFGLLAAQGEDKKTNVLKKVRAQLEESRKAILEQVGKIIDDELAQVGPAKPPVPAPPPAPAPAAAAATPSERAQAIERRLKELREEEQKLRAELLIVKCAAQDEKLYARIRKEGLEPDEAQALFHDAMKAHEDKDFAESIPSFKRIAYAWYDHADKRMVGFACSSGYNVACGYALDKKKTEALDWLEVSINLGYFDQPDPCNPRHESSLQHMEQDTDLVSLRNETRYKEFVQRGKAHPKKQ